MQRHAVLVIDEDMENRRLIKAALEKEYDVFVAADFAEVEATLKKQRFQVIITDQTVCGMPGLDILKKTGQYSPNAVKIILARYADAEMLLNVINNSDVFRYILKPWEPYELKVTVKNAIEKYVMTEENRNLVEKLKENYSKTVLMLANALEARDKFAQGHSERVAYASVCIAKKFDTPQYQREMLYSACLLHDIGKIGVPEEIYRKPGKLDEDDLIYIKAHTTIAERILAPIPDFKEMIPIIRYHHERVDGKGYPDGLKGEEIPFLARIVTVADTFDAITSDRSYRSGKSFEEAIKIIEESKGTQLDAQIVDVFVSLLKTKNISSLWELE
ncbi:MAG: HD domain-containing phosphohydrolase [Deltaproteobacteria bacterium]